MDLSLLHGKDFSTAVGRISSGVLAYCFTILAFSGLNPGRFANWFISELLFSLCEDVGLTSLYPAFKSPVVESFVRLRCHMKIARREENDNQTQTIKQAEIDSKWTVGIL